MPLVIMAEDSVGGKAQEPDPDRDGPLAFVTTTLQRG